MLLLFNKKTKKQEGLYIEINDELIIIIIINMYIIRVSGITKLYKKDITWSEGLISAAKGVAASGLYFNVYSLRN